MGTTCGSVKDIVNVKGAEAKQGRANTNKKYALLDDVLSVKHRRVTDVRFTHSEKKKIYERQICAKKAGLDKAQVAKA